MLIFAPDYEIYNQSCTPLPAQADASAGKSFFCLVSRFVLSWATGRVSNLQATISKIFALWSQRTLKCFMPQLSVPGKASAALALFATKN